MEFISVTSQTSRSLKQHLSRATLVTSTIKLGPVLGNHQATLHISLSRVCLNRVITTLCSDLCYQGRELKHVQKVAQVHQTPPLSITRCSTSQCTQRVNSSRCVFSFTATSDFAIPRRSLKPLCFEPIPPNSCYTSEMCPHLGAV